jgi:hypothetical protein
MIMKSRAEGLNEKVLVSPEWWHSVQVDLQDAIAGCNDIASAIEAHQRAGKYNAETLLDQINGQVREIRKLLDEMVTPI